MNYEIGKESYQLGVGRAIGKLLRNPLEGARLLSSQGPNSKFWVFRPGLPMAPLFQSVYVSFLSCLLGAVLVVVIIGFRISSLVPVNCFKLLFL